MAISQTLQPENAQVNADLRVGEPLDKKIWIDLDNSPHIPFFSPIIKELEARGGDVMLTARDAYQVTELVDLFGLDCYRVGKHYGKNKFLKVFGVLDRALRLSPCSSARNRISRSRTVPVPRCSRLICSESPVSSSWTTSSHIRACCG